MNANLNYRIAKSAGMNGIIPCSLEYVTRLFGGFSESRRIR